MTTRESWLNDLKERLRPLFVEAGYPLPDNIRVSCGFPSRGALSAKKKVIGQCFYSDSSDDHHFEVFISPVLGSALGEMGAAATLVHELCHVVLPKGSKHGPAFAKLMALVGLEGKPTSTQASSRLHGQLVELCKALGPYPHAELRPLVETKPQTNRMFKVSCPTCGYVARVSRKWLEVGPPACTVQAHGLLVREEQTEEGPE